MYYSNDYLKKGGGIKTYQQWIDEYGVTKVDEMLKKKKLTHIITDKNGNRYTQEEN